MPTLNETSFGSFFKFGTWRSPVAYLHGVQGVASSNLVVPTKGVSNETNRPVKLSVYGLFHFFPYQIIAEKVIRLKNKKVNSTSKM